MINIDGSAELNLSNSPSGDHSPVWSPDGNTIMYISKRTGDWEIYAVNSTGGNSRNLTRNSSIDDMGGVWSPDGQYIVYEPRSDDVSALWVMDSQGEGHVQLSTRTPGHFRWSPDATHLAYDSYDDSTCNVYIVNADGTNPINVSRNHGKNNGAGHFAWSPDGKQLGYTSNRSGQSDVYTYGIVDGIVTRLTTLFTDCHQKSPRQGIRWSKK